MKTLEEMMKTDERETPPGVQLDLAVKVLMNSTSEQRYDRALQALARTAEGMTLIRNYQATFRAEK